jgi:hypothetical protein
MVWQPGEQESPREPFDVMAAAAHERRNYFNGK